MKKQPEAFGVMRLLKLVENCANYDGHSWRRLNAALHCTLKMVIEAHVEFVASDVRDIMDRANSGYWIGVNPEWVYSAAVTSANMSACLSYEAWRGREPFIADDVNGRDRDRLCVGSRFRWRGDWVKVNSFSLDGTVANAAKYEDNDDRRKVVKRCKITRADLILDRAERSKRRLAQSDLAELAKTVEGGRERILEMLGAKTAKEFDDLPLDKIKSVLEKLTPGRVPVKRTKELIWLQRRINEVSKCKDVRTFVKKFTSVEALWDAAKREGHINVAADLFRDALKIAPNVVAPVPGKTLFDLTGQEAADLVRTAMAKEKTCVKR